MPALVTHHRFASAALKQAQPYLNSAVSAAPMAFRWGAQGPDPLFYYHPLTHNSVVRTGHLLHDARVSRMFSAMTAACAQTATPEATAYLMGYCCHYALDRTVHPFVTYISNYVLDPLYPQLSLSVLHNMCEAEIDRALIETFYPAGSAAFHAYHLLSADAGSCTAAGALLSQAVWKTYGVRLTPRQVTASMHALLRIQQLLHDKSGRKTAVLQRAEDCVRASGSISSMVRPLRPSEADCLNRAHAAWINAAQPHVRCYTDFFQLFQQAAQEAVRLMDTCYHAVQTGAPLPKELFELNYLGLPEA